MVAAVEAEGIEAIGVAEEALSRHPPVPSSQQQVPPVIEAPNIQTFPLETGPAVDYITDGGVLRTFVLSRQPVHGKTFLLQDLQRIIIIERSTSSAKTTVTSLIIY